MLADTASTATADSIRKTLITPLSWFGTLLLSAGLLTVSGSLSLSIVGTKGARSSVKAARSFFYASLFFVASAAFLLAYAFQNGDFSLRYVAHYSDRATAWPYLLAGLWAGQDGSLLWWTLTLSVLSGLSIWRLPKLSTSFEAYLIATLSAVIGFFLLLMLFAADPFASAMGRIPLDGQGLNPLLRNPWMLIHPPVLYLGMVGWAVPFAFAVAALWTGELGEQWIQMARPWVIFAWGTLAMGNVLGMIWSYEVLGWGGYWAWDPVENASFLPMLSGTAYLHSAIAQERRGAFKGWNIGLLCLTFFMTVFGTFLTRSGLIASVHAFSRSGMAGYFLAFMALVAMVSIGLIYWRRGEITSPTPETVTARTLVFELINLLMMAMLIFVSAATLFPLASEAIRGETVSVSAAFYNRWMAPLGLALLCLLALGPLTSWGKSGDPAIRRRLIIASACAAAIAIAQIAFGSAVGLPPLAPLDSIAPAPSGAAQVMERGYTLIPFLIFSSGTFTLIAHLLELFKMLASALRAGSGAAPITRLKSLAKIRRYLGSNLVHVGTVVMCFGFAGSAYDHETQAALFPGEAMTAGHYQVRYDRPHMEPGLTKQTLLANVTLLTGGKALGTLAPRKFFYNKPPETTTTEVAIRSNLARDVYVILNSVNPSNRVATFRVIVRPLVAWIWIGGLLMALGSLLALSFRRKPLETKTP